MWPDAEPVARSSGHCFKPGKYLFLKTGNLKKKPQKQPPENSHHEQSGGAFRQNAMLALETTSFTSARSKSALEISLVLGRFDSKVHFRASTALLGRFWSTFLQKWLKKRHLLIRDFARVWQFWPINIRIVRHAHLSRTNVNPARMFNAGLTPTFHILLLRDRQSRINPAWRRGILLQNLLQSRPIFQRKNSQKLIIKFSFYDDVDKRPMHSLRSPTWRFSPFRYQDSTCRSPQTRDSSAIGEKSIRNRPINDQENDPKNRNSSSWKTLKVNSKNVISSKNCSTKPLGSPSRTWSISWNPGFGPPRIQDSAVSKSRYCGFLWNNRLYQQPQNTVELGL